MTRTLVRRSLRGNIAFPITVIPVPSCKPGTKPKALNVALPFARGTFTVIYDAEDRPERNQLRVALTAFRSAGDDLACVQARLCTDTQTSWLARYFTAEYAGHFDVLLPKLAATGLPLPLGGSSNHFRTEALRQVCGWDPYNVTEDADLGMRLARFGYRSDVIDSTTYEEATSDISRWLGRRTRWFKGLMQLSRNDFSTCFQNLILHRLSVATSSQQSSSCADVRARSQRPRNRMTVYMLQNRRFCLSDRESGFSQTVMSALPPKADMCSANRDVRFGQVADTRGAYQMPDTRSVIAPIARNPFLAVQARLVVGA